MILVFLLIFCVITALVSGVVLMAFGGRINKKYSNKLMIARVVFQFLTVVMVFLLYLYSKK